jgi:glycosyltransferase involved in cell wall biosynthesis
MLVLIDGLALGALPEAVEREAARLRIVGLVHHPLANETGLAPDLAARLEASERRALAAVRAVVVTSRTTAGALQAYGVSADDVTVVEPGTDFGPPARSSRPEVPGADSAELALLCVATLTPRKGHEILFRALAATPHRRWRLICAGSVDRDPATVARLRAQLDADGIADRVALVGDLDARALDAQYAAADLFVLPTLHEGYGMAVAEALARGLPVVSTATGAVDDLVTGGFGRPCDQPAGIVVPPGDEDAFAQALARVLGDADLRARLAGGARLARARLPLWPDACASMERVLDRVAAS